MHYLFLVYTKTRIIKGFRDGCLQKKEIIANYICFGKKEKRRPFGKRSALFNIIYKFCDPCFYNKL
jgi:hypothetical protein